MSESAARSLPLSPMQVQVIAAVDHLVRTQGWTATSMSDVARVAGVSRQTVYNEFGSRDRLIEAYVRREVEALIAGVEDAVREHAHDARAALAAAYEQFLQLASDEPLIKVIAAGTEGARLVSMLTGLGESIATTRVGALITEVWPQVGDADARLLAATLARLAVSHALLPTDNPAGLGRAGDPGAGPVRGRAGRHRARVAELRAGSGSARQNAGPRPSRMAPAAVAGSTPSPCWRTTTTCAAASSPATLRAASMSSRQFSPPATRAASLGQMVASGRRWRSSVRIAAASRVR